MTKKIEREKYFTQHFEFIYNFFCDISASKNVKPTNAGFCELLGISTGKFQAWRMGQWPSAEDLVRLHEVFGFSYIWLITGEGDPWETAPAQQAKSLSPSKEAQTFGERLAIALEYRRLSTEYVLRETGFSPEELDELTSGMRLPSFYELETLYTALGIEPAYFFHGDETQMYIPQTQLERVMGAIGAFSQYTPSHFSLQRWFGISKEEAKAYLADYKAGRKNIEIYGTKECEERELCTEKVMPSTWLEYFSEHARLSLPWLYGKSRIPALWHDHVITGAEISNLLELYEENRQLRMRIEQLQKTEPFSAASEKQ